MSRPSMWAKTRTKKDGNPVNDTAAGLIVSILYQSIKLLVYFIFIIIFVSYN